MGRWAQAKRRGGHAAQPSAPTAPPAPLLSIVGPNLVQTAQGAADPGGTVELWMSETEVGGYGQISGPNPWAAVYSWGPWAGYPEGFYYVKETGNGTVYVGTSLPSNILQQTP
jgi:hypothetical protein